METRPLSNGTNVSDVTYRIVETLDFQEDAILDYRVKHLRIPIRQVEPELLEWAERILTEKPTPSWINEKGIDPKWIRAASIMSVHLLRQREQELDYEIQVFRIGDVAIVALPGEPFVEGQLRIKMSSPAKLTYLAHCTT